MRRCDENLHICIPSGSSSAPALILSVGRLVQKKGHDVLIQALGLLHHRGVRFECCIVGDGPLGRQWRELARRCDVEGKVELVPVASQAEIRRLYERSSLFALACTVADDGDRDGIPNVLIEAMAMQLPVVSTFVAGIPELITPDREGMLVPPDSVEELADAIEDLLDDPVKRQELGLAAREKVSREFELRSNTDLLGASLRDVPSSDKVMSS